MARFVKGMTGNPKGRPKALFDIQELVRSKSKQNIEVMERLRDGAEDENVRLRAAIALHEIAWGKPAQAVTAAVTHGVTDELAALVSGLRSNVA